MNEKDEVLKWARKALEVLDFYAEKKNRGDCGGDCTDEENLGHKCILHDEGHIAKEAISTAPESVRKP